MPHISQRPARRSFRNAAALITAAAILIPILPAQSAVAAEPSLNTEFVTRDGSELRLGGERFTASGANIYWLGLDENVGGVDFPTYFRIKDALDTAQQLGVNVVRSHMMTSTGQDNANPLALMPALGEYNDEAFATIDFAVAYAGSLGIRFILPLTDEWEYYHGGHRDFTSPLGLESADFYTDPAAIAAYQDYVDRMINHVNPLTGLRLGDDPTVLAWELGNELEGMTLPWIDEQVSFIRDRAPEQLVAAGRRFDIDPDTLQAADLDIVDVHYYPPTAERISSDAATVAAAGKVYIAGEYASTAATADVLVPVASDPNVSGTFFWSLFGNNDRGGLVPHDDGFTLHYPGETDRMRTNVAAIQDYSAALGRPVNDIALEAPLVTAVDQFNAINRISWRGTAGAVSYLVQRTIDGQAWTDVSAPVGPEASPLTDLESPMGAAYRVIAEGPDGTQVASDPVDATMGGNVVVDPLSDFKLTSSYSGVALVAPNGALAQGEATAVWAASGIDTASFRILGATNATVASSNDGITWTDLDTEITTEGDATVVAADDVQADFVRVSWPDGSVLDRATVGSAAARVALFDPLDDFSQSIEQRGSLSFDTGNPDLFGGDTSRVKRDASDGDESITWTYDDISGADLVAYAWPDQPVQHITLEGSADGEIWAELQPEILGGTGNWRQFTYRVRDLTDTNFLRASWAGGPGEVWTPQLSQLSIFSPNVAELDAPTAVELVSPADGQRDVQSTPVFSWTPSADAAYYRFTLATDAEFEEDVHTQTGLTRTSYQPPIDLQPGTTFYWRVDSVNGLGSASSGTGNFATAPSPTEALVIEDFESYDDSEALVAAYPRNPGGGEVTATLVDNPSTGSVAGQFAYDLGAPGYAGVIRTLPEAQSWYGYRGIGIALSAPVGATVSVQFVADGGFWEAEVPIVDEGLQTVEIPFSDFAPPAFAAGSRLNLSSVTQFAFYVADVPTGQVIVDDMVALAPVAVEPEPEPEPGTGPGATPGAGSDGDAVGSGGDQGGSTADGDLAFTGPNVAPIGLLAMLLMLIGVAAYRASRVRSIVNPPSA